MRRAVDAPWREVDFRSCGNELVADRGVTHSHTHGGWDGGVETKGFVTDGVEEGKGIEDPGKIEGGIFTR